MGFMDKIWHFFGLVRLPGEAGDRILELQYRHLKKNIPWLYLVMIFDILSCIYAVTDSSSIILRVVLPVLVTSILAGRMALWFLRRHRQYEPAEALKLLRSVAVAAAVIGPLCALWSVLAWQWETSSFRYYIPAFLALGAFSTAYCMSLVPRSAILNVLTGVLPISTMLFFSGVMIDFALAATMVASTFFLIGMIQWQFRQTIKMTNLQIEMHQMAHTDTLTGLYNRRAFHEQLDQAIEQLDGDGDITLAMFDLDGFKGINDRYGHLAGDQVLQIAARRLKDSAGEYGQVFRLGGDEFAILFSGPPPIFCNQLAQLAVRELEQPMPVGGKHLDIGASFGLTSVTAEHDIQAIDMISRTDQSLYEMKEQSYGTKQRTSRALRLAQNS